MGHREAFAARFFFYTPPAAQVMPTMCVALMSRVVLGDLKPAGTPLSSLEAGETESVMEHFMNVGIQTKNKTVFTFFFAVFTNNNFHFFKIKMTHNYPPN